MPSRIIVLGIYRSGTSLNTALVHRWGAYIGEQDELFSDRYGYIEHLALQKLNDDLLNNNVRVPPPADALVERSRDPIFKERALEIIHRMDKETKKNQAVAWVWKDPRLPLVLPFWANIWEDVIYVIPVRHPAETILSGAEMEGVPADNLPFSAGFAYWQYSLLNVLLFTQTSRRKIFMAYDQLIGNPLPECTRLCLFLDQQCERQTTSASQRIEAMVAQIDPRQHHHRNLKSLSEIEQTTREQRALYNFLRVKTMYPDEVFNKDDFALYPGWREYLQVMDMLLALSESPESEISHDN